MKTKHLIGVLRCPGDHRMACVKCEVFDTCKELAGQDLWEVCAERMEALLENLRRTEAELKEARQEAKMWKKRHERFLKDMKEAVHEQEILDGVGGY